MNINIGDCIEFEGTSKIKIFGFIAKIENDGTISYVRDSLTRWNVTKELVLNTGNNISLDNFISRVKFNAEKSSHSIPSSEQVIKVLEKFKENFDCDLSEIFEILEIKENK